MLDALIALVGMFFMYAIVFGLDAWTKSLLIKASATFRMGPYFWGSLSADLLIALGLFLLAWLANFRLKRSLGASVVYILGGLLGMITSIFFNLGFVWVMRTFRLDLMPIVAMFDPSKHFALLSLFLIISGVAGLFKPRS